MTSQLEIISLEQLVPPTHSYRKFAEAFDFSAVCEILKSAEKGGFYKGYGVLRFIQMPPFAIYGRPL